MTDMLVATTMKHSQPCDGCRQLVPICELVSVGDGSVKVCRKCLADRTAGADELRQGFMMPTECLN